MNFLEILKTNKSKIFLFLSIFFFVLSFLFLKHYCSIFYFQNDLNKISVNVELKDKNTSKDDEVLVCFNKNCDKMEFLNNVYSYKLNQENPLFYEGEVDNIELIVKNKSFIDDIKNVTIFNGADFQYFKKSDLKQTEIDDADEKINSIYIPCALAHKTFFQKLAVYFESLFYNWYFYLFAYSFLLLFAYRFSKEKQSVSFLKKNDKLKKISPVFLILLLGFLLRLSHIDFIPLWNDELYTIHYVSDGLLNFKKVISDPGNPPIFFLISNLWLLKFNSTIAQIRFLPLLMGLAQIYSIYFIVDKILSKKEALFASFLSAINIFIIVESNEIRSYILTMTLILWGAYYFYKLFKDFSKKNLITYSIIATILINTHYYALLFVVSNLIFGLIFLKNVKYEKLKFLGTNVVSILTFAPYFLLTMLNSSFKQEFNSWLEKPTVDVIYNHIIFYFGNWFFFIVAIIFSIFVYKKYLKKTFEAKVFLYNVFSIAIVFILAFLISVFVKPILFERYFCIFLPLLIVNTVILLNVFLKKSAIMSFLIFIFALVVPKYENYNLFSNIDFMGRYSSIDFNYYIQEKTHEPYFVIPDRIDYIKQFPKLQADRVIVSNLGTREDKNLIEEYKKDLLEKNKSLKGKKVVLYVPEICTNSKIKYSNSINVQKIETSILPVYKIFLNL